MDGPALVRLAQLRSRVAQLARGGRFDVAGWLLDQLVRADLALGLTADSVLRARQAAQLAHERGEPVEKPMLVLAASLLAAGAYREAIEAAEAGLRASGFGESPEAGRRTLCAACLVGGSAHRRLGHLEDARVLLDEARKQAAANGASDLAGLALAELARVDLGEGAPEAAAVCFEYAAEFLKRGGKPALAIEARTLAIVTRAQAGALDEAAERAAHAADDARAAGRLDLVALLDGALADAAIAAKRDQAALVQASALASESAHAAGSRELAVQARLRQARVVPDASDRARHVEAAVELARGLPRARAGALLGGHLMATGDPDVARALVELGDDDLAAIAREALAAVR